MKLKDLPYISEKEFPKIVGTAMTYITSMSPSKIRAVLYFLFYTGMNKTPFLKLNRKEIKQSKRNKKFFISRKLRKILRQYFSLEPEKINAFNVTDKILRRFFDDIKYHTGKKIIISTLRKSYLIRNKKEESSNLNK